MNQSDFEDNTRSFIPISKETMISHDKIIEKDDDCVLRTLVSNVKHSNLVFYEYALELEV